MTKPELLAPAGNMDSLVAAISAGADAVYLAGKLFGARAFANNFSDEELIEAIKYAHLYNVKVYITINTLIYENEVDKFLEYVDFIHKNNVDAVIVQDLGMIDLLHKTYPNLEIHASTQAHIHNLDGVEVMKKLGVKRVVLARETSIDTIKDIKNKTDVELEVFVHGALCISYSGQCLMSSLIGGRSGNRGSCAGSCRQKYALVDEFKNDLTDFEYLLSTKDLNSLENLDKLLSLNVSSLKIEGRMKRSEYVYLVVSIYRKAIDSYYETGKVNISNEDIYELKKIFNRGFTKGFLFNTDNNDLTNSYRPNHMGVTIGRVIKYSKGKVYVKLNKSVKKGDGIRIINNPDIGLTLLDFYIDDKKVNEAFKNNIISFKYKDLINKNSEVLKTTDVYQLENIKELISNKPKILLDMTITLQLNKPVVLEIDDYDIKVISDELVQVSLNNPVTNENIKKQLSKLGDTVYKLNNLKIISDDNIFISLKCLNELRRKIIDILNEKRLYQINYKKENYYIDLPDFEISKNTNIKINNLDDYDNFDKYNNFYTTDLYLYNQISDNKKVIYSPPRVINSYENYDGYLLLQELGGINKFDSFETDVFFNVTNSYTVALLHSLGSKKVTLSHELDFNQVKDIVDGYHKRYNKHPNLEVIIYGREEAMISKFNLLKKCNYLNNKAYLKDRFNNLYPIEINNDLMLIYNYKVRNDKNDYFRIGVNNIRINKNI